MTLAPLTSLGLVSSHTNLLATGQRRYAIKRAKPHSSFVILSLTTLCPVKRFVATLRRQRWKQRHFALVEKSLMTRPSSSLSSILQRDLRSHHPSLRDLHPRLLTSISPTLQGGRLPTQALGS